MSSLSIDQAIDLALQHQGQGRLAEAEKLYRGVLSAQPRHPEASHNLGVLLLELNRLPEALENLRTALEADPRDGQVWVSYIDALIHAARYDDARSVLELGQRRGLAGPAVQSLQRRLDVFAPAIVTAGAGAALPATAPAQPPVRDVLARIYALRDDGKLGEGEALARELTGRAPEHAGGWHALATLLRMRDRLDDALAAVRRAVQLAPDDPQLHFELGLVLRRLGLDLEAEASYRRGLQINPQNAEAYNELALILERTDRLDDAVATYRRALALSPDASGALSNMAIALIRQQRLDEAEAALRRAIEVEPDNAGAYVNLAGLLKDTGRLPEAISGLRRAIEQFPDLLAAHDVLLFSLNYSADYPPAACLEEARRYGAAASRRVKARYTSWQHAPAPTRLRVGIMSGDIHSHPVGFFLENVLRHLDRDRVELAAFVTSSRSDALTERVKPLFASWELLGGRTDETAAALIHERGVHVLLELSGHTRANRLPVLAWKPAPVQASWLGYFATTGLDEIDYYLADETSVPPAHRAHFTETVWYLPDTRLCFTPPEVDVAVAPLPALGNGFITFGSFQNLAKLSERTLALWGRVLAAVPQARLRLQSVQLTNAGMREMLLRRLADVGVAAERIALHGTMTRDAYLRAHGEVDFILDTTPFPGGTTTCEALWMGVPTLTLAGDRLIARQGASLMRAAGLPQWVAEDEETFVAKAVDFARDLGDLARLRAELRPRLPATPLFDARRFATHLEDALWQMWRTWESRQVPGRDRAR